MPHFFRVIDPSRSVVGVEKLPSELAVIHGIYRKKLANQCSMPIFLLKVFKNLVCCKWKFYNLVAWLPGKFLRVRCSLPGRLVFWKRFHEIEWLAWVFLLTPKRHDKAFDGLPLHQTDDPSGRSHKRSGLRSFRRASLRAADAFPGTSFPWLSESSSKTGRSARWRCQLADAAGMAHSLGQTLVPRPPEPLEIVDWVAAAVARQVCEKSINFITFESTEEKIILLCKSCEYYPRCSCESETRALTKLFGKKSRKKSESRRKRFARRRRRKKSTSREQSTKRRDN